MFLGGGCPVILGTRKPAPDHRASQLLLQQRPVLLILSLWLPLSFSAMLQAATLWAGTPSARAKDSQGAVPG